MATRPGAGPVALSGTAALKRARGRRDRTGEWRPDLDYNGKDGLKVTLRRIPGMTPTDRLLVPMRFQCPIVGEFARDWSFEWGKFSTLRMGERSRPQGAPLRSWSFSTILLDGPATDDATFLVWDGPADPQKVIAELALISGDNDVEERNQPAPFRLTVSQTAVWGPATWLVNSPAVLSSLRATQRPGEVGVEYVDFVFDEYDPMDVERKQASDPRRQAHTHTFHLGDDLYEIAKRYYRSPSKWRHIATANGIKGVSPGSEAELAAWAARHRKSKLTIPPLED